MERSLVGSMSSPQRVLASLGMVSAAALSPPLYAPLFALAPLDAADMLPLCAASGALFVVSLGIYAGWLRGSLLLRCLGASLLVVSVECTARLAVKPFPEKRAMLVKLARITYADQTKYVGHAFLQYVGRPERQAPNDGLSSTPSSFNSRGFIGHEFTREPTPGTIRVACLGGSTTAYGFPPYLEQYLNERNSDAKPKYEVLNFGHSFYTSAHSLVNFALNVRDYSPQYVIVHDAWNDVVARTADGAFYSDYSHALKPFSPELPPDRWLIRASVFYRALRQRLAPRSDWVALSDATKTRAANGGRSDALAEDARRTFKRNIRTIIELGRSDGIMPVLTTMPYDTDARAAYADEAAVIGENNQLVRELAQDYGAAVVFVDLDRDMTGRWNDSFLDVGHLRDPGKQHEARLISDAIHAHREALQRARGG